MIYERRADQVRNLTEDWDRSVDGLVWSPDSSEIFGSIDDAAHDACTASLRVADSRSRSPANTA